MRRTRKRKTDFTRCATSFPPEEIEIACSVFMGLLSGADVSMLTRRAEYKTLASRFERMRIRLDEKQQELEVYEAQMAELEGEEGEEDVVDDDGE